MLVTGVEASASMWLKVNLCIVQICDISYVANAQFTLLNFRGKVWNEIICKIYSNPSDSTVLYMLSCGPGSIKT